MKNLLIFALIIVSLPIFCQNNEEKIHKPLPLELGININKFNSKNYGIENRIGFGLSIKRIWRADKKINILSGLAFYQTHYYQNAIDNGQMSMYQNIDLRLYTFSIPLLIRANFGKTYKLFIETGISLDFMPYLHGNGTILYFNPYYSLKNSQVSQGFDNRVLDFGANFTAGFKFPVNKYRFFISSTYHIELNEYTPPDLNPLNNFITLNLGMFIH